MKCDLCDTLMFVNEWNGWRWECPLCGKDGEVAPDSDIVQQMKDTLESLSEIDNNNQQREMMK